MPLAVTLENRQKKGQGMAVAIVGLPAGMKVPTDLKQLTDLREKGTISLLRDPRPRAGAVLAGVAPEQKIDADGRSGVRRARRVPRAGEPRLPVLQRRPQALGRAAVDQDRRRVPPHGP